MKPPFFGINVAKCNLGSKVNLEAMLVSCFPSYSRGGLMPLAGAPRDLYTQLLACTSLQSVVAIACCLRASLCFGFACLLFLLVQGLLIEPTIVWLLVWMGRTPHQIPFCRPSHLVLHRSLLRQTRHIFNSFRSSCCCWCPRSRSNRCNRQCREGLVSCRKRSWL